MSLLAEMNQKAAEPGLAHQRSPRHHLPLQRTLRALLSRSRRSWRDDDGGNHRCARTIWPMPESFFSRSAAVKSSCAELFEIVERARQLLFNVKVKTNGVMIREKEAARLRQLGVEQVQISVYSHRPEVHDAITKLPGSLKPNHSRDSILEGSGTEGHSRQRSYGGQFL